MAVRAPPWEETPRPKRPQAPLPPLAANAALPKVGPEAGPTQRSPHPGAQRHGISARRKPTTPEHRRHVLVKASKLAPTGGNNPDGRWRKEEKNRGKPARESGHVRPGAPKGDDEGPGPGTDRTDVKKEPLLRRFAPGRGGFRCPARRRPFERREEPPQGERRKHRTTEVLSKSQ